MFPMNEQFTGFFQNFQPANEQFTRAFKNLFSGASQFPGIDMNAFSDNEQYVNALQTTAKAQVAFLTKLSTAVLDSTSKLVELNMSAAKTSLDESTVVANQLLASKSAQEAMQLVAALPQPTVTKAVAYSRHLMDIASAAQAELTRVTQEQLEETVRIFTVLVDEAAKKAPAGSEAAFALMKSGIANASTGYNQLSKATKQSTEVVQANVANAVDQITQVSEQVAAAAGRTRK